MRGYYKVVLGTGNAHAAECISGNFIGTDYGVYQDLTGQLPERWQEFNRKFIPVIQADSPGKSKIGAGLACGALWTVSRGILKGDFVLTPDGGGRFRVAEVIGDYQYVPTGPLQHRRPVRWLESVIDRADMSDALRGSADSRGTVAYISKHGAELERLISGVAPVAAAIVEQAIEEASAFAM